MTKIQQIIYWIDGRDNITLGLPKGYKKAVETMTKNKIFYTGKFIGVSDNGAIFYKFKEVNK